MHLDVVDLKTFYYRTKLGRSTQRALQAGMGELWPDVRGMSVGGYGFAVPVLRPFIKPASRVIGLMPGQQGVIRWPAGQPNLTALVEETLWPLEAGQLDRLVLLHGLETCDSPDALLAEVWRVLAPGGRVVFIVPNRAGIWARRDITPFGYGHPYSIGQLETALKRHRFQPERHRMALYTPPSQRRFWLKSTPFWEKWGPRMGGRLVAGAILLEATKQVYALPRGGLREAVKAPVGILQGKVRPKPAGRKGAMRTHHARCATAGRAGFNPPRRD